MWSYPVSHEKKMESMVDNWYSLFDNHQIRLLCFYNEIFQYCFPIISTHLAASSVIPYGEGDSLNTSNSIYKTASSPLLRLRSDNLLRFSIGWRGYEIRFIWFFVNFFFGSFCWIVWIKIEVDFNFFPIIFLRVLFVMQHPEGKRDGDSFYWESKSPYCKSAALITDNLNTTWKVLISWMESSVKLPRKVEQFDLKPFYNQVTLLNGCLKKSNAKKFEWEVLLLSGINCQF